MEEKRELLYILIERYGTQDPIVIKCSEELDNLISDSYRQSINASF